MSEKSHIYVKFDGESIFDGLRAVRGAFRNAPKKTAKNGHFWACRPQILYFLTTLSPEILGAEGLGWT